jgi:hypothetical protein
MKDTAEELLAEAAVLLFMMLSHVSPSSQAAIAIKSWRARYELYKDNRSKR